MRARQTFRGLVLHADDRLCLRWKVEATGNRRGDDSHCIQVWMIADVSTADTAVKPSRPFEIDGF